MKMTPSVRFQISSELRFKERAQIRVVFLATISFLLGVAATTAWFHFNPGQTSENSLNSKTVTPPAGESSAAVANRPSRPFVAGTLPADAATLAEVRQTIPNYASVSLADGEQILRDAALKEFAAATREMEVQVSDAQKQLAQAQNDQSVAAQKAAREHLQQVQAEQSGKLQQIAGHLQTQIAAWKQLKGTRP